MENKTRILLIPSDLMGVGHFRSIWPAQSMQNNFANEIEVEIGIDIDINNIDYLSQFDIIHFHRQFGDYAKFPEISKKLREKGIIMIMDLDDYWEPPTTHPLYEIVKKEGLSAKILNNLKHVDCVTTTTEIFKKYILKYNPYVHIIPNALDMNHKMWKSEVQENKSGKCRISWIGGSSHLHDLLQLEDSMLKVNLSQELENKYQIVMCGFDIRGTITEFRPDNSSTTRPIKPHESIWNRFEQIFTSNYTLIKNKEYAEYLKTIKKEDFEGFELENYVRRWTLPLTQYGKHYDYCDVCLAPLEDIERYKQLPDGEIVSIYDQRPGTVKTRPHIFNEVKSELKIIEAGMKGKVLIAQDFGIYKKLIKNRENGILIPTFDNKKGWHRAIKEIILNPELREKLANNLHNFVKDKYELKNVTKERVDFYKKIIEDKKNGILSNFEKARNIMNIPPESAKNVFNIQPKINLANSISQPQSLKDILQKTSKKTINRPYPKEKFL
jgi:glycosyltransferase involved in cell wall biosynthesis